MDLSRMLRVGTFNTYNLASPNIEFHHSKVYDNDEYEKKKGWIADQLRTMECDIVGFQEVLHKDALGDAIAESGLYDGAPWHFVQNTSPDGKMVYPGNGFVSRLPVKEVRTYRDFPERARIHYGSSLKVPIDFFNHPVIRACVELPNGMDAYVFIVHLKSMRPAFRDEESKSDPYHRAIATARATIRRAAEAVGLRFLLLDLLRNTDTPVILIGDLNASVTAPSAEILAGVPPWNYMPPRTRTAIKDVLLYSVKDVQALRTYQDVYYTHIHNGSYQALDHIYVSEEFVRGNPNHIGYIHNVRVYNDHLVDYALLGDSVERWKSDHGQVVAEIVINEVAEK